MDSIISLDLGGENTGFFSFTSNDVSKIDSFQSGTIIYDESFVLSQVGRRGKRHTKRNNLRNKLVKRLFLVVLQKHYGLELSFLPDEILGLFNKRGYTYASFELNDEKKEKLSKELKSGLKIIEDILNDHDKQQNQGNLPRAKYFIELNQEIEQNKETKLFFETHNLKIEDMQNLIGNLSNYQLKELRRYFNDEIMKNGDVWNETKLHKITWRFIQSWHSKNDADKQRQKDNLESLKHWKNPNKKNIIEFLTTTDPIKTIPPYDDMNNRGAVKCQTLRLNEEYLDIHLPNWRNITEKLASENQRDNVTESTIKKWSEDSTLLHRILDTTASIDPYILRSDKIDGYIDILGKNDALSLQKFAKNYYELIRSKVRTGIWTSSDDMLKKCDHNPPYKNNQIHNLVAGILGQAITEEQFKKFETELWNAKFGNKKLVSYCKNIEELRKSHGNLFKSYIEEITKKEIKELSKDEKSDFNLLSQTTLDEWTNKIGEFFGIEAQYRARFNNHFSMAQLHTIIDTKRSGFNSTCKWCSAENQFRATTNIEINPETGEVTTNANCQRLPADTQRPFSGKIERYIDKLGYEIAKIKAKEIEQIKDKKIDLKIILEQNAFEYEETIRSAKIKNANAKAKKNLEDATKKHKKSLDDKTARVKAFSGAICPYCGQSLGEDGEIDHILPRSYTLKNYDTVFNSEGNLLFVHQKCNQAKKETIYKLSDIKTPITQQEIENIINPISKNSYKTFTALSPEQQKAFKYALFLDNNNEAYQKVVSWLRTDQSSRVNGTQKYLAKKIQEKLKIMLPNKEFDFEFILADANDVHNLREKYQLPQKPKDTKQETYSHTIDAVMSLVSVWDKVLPKADKPKNDDILKFANVENWSAIENEFLTKGKSANQKIEEMIETKDFSQKNMRQIFSKPIFGENALGERFKPIIKLNEQYFIGYPIKRNHRYDLCKCKEIKVKNDIRLLKAIINIKKFVLKQEKQQILIYEINKKYFNEMSNNYFNINYKKLNCIGKTKANLLEFIAQNCKYYTKKVDVKFAPSYKKEIEEMKYPFYNEWKLFDEAWQHLKINENKKDFRDRYLIDKTQINQSYQIQKDEYKIDGDIAPLWDDFCRWYFLDRFQKDENKKTIRAKARKKFSLIAVGGTQGKVFRVKRKTPNGFVYQALPMDNNIIAGDYANVLLEGNKHKISLVTKEPKKDLLKELKSKEAKDIRDIKIEASKFFKDGFDCSGIEVILNKTSATIKNFPLAKIDKKIKKLILKTLFEKKDGKRQKQKSSISLKEKNTIQEELKKLLKDSIKVVVRDGSISGIEISKKTVNFTLPFKSENLAKLLDD